MNTPTTSLSETDRKISLLNESWRKKFEILAKADADGKSPFAVIGSPSFRDLPAKERSKISFNIWAFLLSIIYYWVKGMWVKGFLLIGVTNLVAIPFFFLQILTGIAFPVFVIPAVLAGGMANIDYYNFVKTGQKAWPGTPAILSSVGGAASFALLTLLLEIGIAELFS